MKDMKEKKQLDLLKVFEDLRKTINKKISYKQMLDEIRMMNFKIRPKQGDILLFNLKDKQFIKIIWKLGKLDQLFQDTYHKISPKDKDIFLQMFNDMYQELQKDMVKINFNSDVFLDQFIQTSPVVEIEIFKEQQQKKLN